MGVVPKSMAAGVPRPVVVVAIIVFAAAASPWPPTTVAGLPQPPLVENLPTTVAAQDFIRTRCQFFSNAQDDARMCYELLLPYATSINGSYNRATIAAFTAMFTKLTSFAGRLKDERSPPSGECIQVINETISAAKETLAKLGRLDEEVNGSTNQDFEDLQLWLSRVRNDLSNKCPCQADPDGQWSSDDIAVIRKYAGIADGLISSTKRTDSLPSPDGS